MTEEDFLLVDVWIRVFVKKLLLEICFKPQISHERRGKVIDISHRSLKKNQDRSAYDLKRRRLWGRNRRLLKQKFCQKRGPCVLIKEVYIPLL